VILCREFKLIACQRKFITFVIQMSCFDVVVLRFLLCGFIIQIYQSLNYEFFIIRHHMEMLKRNQHTTKSQHLPPSSKFDP
jgi:hypothetical protein